ncbi:MAG: hypothetical protein IJ506_00730 [Clostridia bacterium]|nr:hypothetical protein [Clostridia bacterium]
MKKALKAQIIINAVLTLVVILHAVYVFAFLLDDLTVKTPKNTINFGGILIMVMLYVTAAGELVLVRFLWRVAGYLRAEVRKYVNTAMAELPALGEERPFKSRCLQLWLLKIAVALALLFSAGMATEMFGVLSNIVCWGAFALSLIAVVASFLVLRKIYKL